MKIKSISLVICCLLLIILLFNEFLIYYFTLYKCKWPHIPLKQKENPPVKAMLLADVHLLGPFRGHWADKLKREWQMHRSFQTAIQLFQPEVIFMLGDVFDEGQWVNSKQFKEYIIRFRRLFHVPFDVQIYGVAGNHDVGFHYVMNPILLDRFDKVFNNTDNSLLSIRGNHFIFINSMSMEQDGCKFCMEAEENLRKISKQFECAQSGTQASCKNIQKLGEYSQPIIMQHFPTYRKSDKECIEHDHVNSSEIYRQNWEVLSKTSTRLLGKLFKPRLVFGGHSHHYCKLINSLDIEEYTIASFSWRNKNDPSFLLAEFKPNEYAVNVCKMPLESTVNSIYFWSFIFIILFILFNICSCFKIKRKISHIE